MGVAHIGHTAKKPDGYSIRDSRYLLTLAGAWGTSPSAMWSNFKNNFDIYTNAYNLTTDATSGLNDVMKANGFGQPTHGYEVKIMPGNSGVYGVYDEHSDTTGLGNSMDSMLSTIRKK